jgi:hypothetical protein
VKKLLVRCPKAKKRRSDPGVYPINVWWECECHGVDDQTLLPAKPDDIWPGGTEAAIARMRPVLFRILSEAIGPDLQVTRLVQDDGWRHESLARMLAAALREEE